MRLFVVPLALSDKTRDGSMCFQPFNTGSGRIGSTNCGADESTISIVSATEFFDSVSLSDSKPEDGAWIVSVDVEGFEYAVSAAMKNIFAHPNVERIIMEVSRNDHPVPWNSSREFFMWFQDQGYEVGIAQVGKEEYTWVTDDVLSHIGENFLWRRAKQNK
jgi:hypothetical protein